MLRRIQATAILASLVAYLAAGAASGSPQLPPQTLNIKQPDTQSEGTPKEQKIAKSVWERFSIVWDRTWDDPVAFYTFVLSIFTALLAFVSALQIAFLTRADKTARMTAEATRDSVKVARDEFNATHRPRLRVRLVRLDRIDDEGIKAHYTIVNAGETAATITWHDITLYAEPNNDMAKAIQQGCLPGCPKLAGGESKIFLIEMRFGPEQQYDFHFNVAVGGRFRIRGHVEYQDGAGIKRRTGFLRTYDATHGCFRADDSEEEYED